MAKLEKTFQAQLRKEIETRFPGSVVTKLDSGDIQGIPDLAIFYGSQWAWLEVKRSKDAPEQPNQNFYLNKGIEMSFAAKIYPENKEEVLDALQQTFTPRGSTRIPRGK